MAVPLYQFHFVCMLAISTVQFVFSLFCASCLLLPVVWQHSFVDTGHEIFSTAILSLPLIHEGQLSVSGERMCICISKKTGVSVLLRFFISSHDVCYTAYAFYRIHEQLRFQRYQNGPNDPSMK